MQGDSDRFPPIRDGSLVKADSAKSEELAGSEPLTGVIAAAAWHHLMAAPGKDIEPKAAAQASRLDSRDF